jgi:hypothetical protein
VFDKEYKVTDSAGVGSVSNTGTMASLTNSLIRGTDYLNQFEGGRILPEGIQIRYEWTMGSLAGVGDGTNVCRVIIFQWMDSIVPTVAGILQTVNPLSAVLLTNRSNIIVLHDRLVSLKQYAPNGNDAQCVQAYVKGKRMVPMEFPSGAVIPQKGGLYALFLSDSTVAPAPNLDFYFRVTFTDT